MEERIRKAGLAAEIRRLLQQPGQRMGCGQSLEGQQELTDVAFGRTKADAPAELLQHIDAAAPVRCIHHEMHRALRLEHAAQRTQPRGRVRQMMQYPGADDLVEGSSE